MFIAGHVVAGAIVGQQLEGHFALIVLLGIASHFVLDIIPHGDYHQVEWYFNGQKEKMKKLYSTIVIDAVAAVIMTAIILSYLPVSRAAVAWGIIWGVLPDLLVGIGELVKSKWLKAFSKLHFIIHDALAKKIRLKPLPGALGQIAIIGIMIYALSY